MNEKRTAAGIGIKKKQQENSVQAVDWPDDEWKEAVHYPGPEQ